MIDEQERKWTGWAVVSKLGDELIYVGGRSVEVYPYAIFKDRKDADYWAGQTGRVIPVRITPMEREDG